MYRDPADMLARYGEILAPAGVTPSRLA